VQEKKEKGVGVFARKFTKWREKGNLYLRGTLKSTLRSTLVFLRISGEVRTSCSMVFL
jgi:hypothetical protein